MVRLKQHPEFILQSQICDYLRQQYPEINFLSDTIGSIRLTGAQAGRNAKIQKKGFKPPDLIIFEPRKGYNGLLIELKVNTPYKLDGKLKKDEHLEAQAKSIAELKAKNYYATFSWGFDRTQKLIDWYLN